MFSERVSTHVTARPRWRATPMATTCSAVMPALPPKPPPTSGAITRIWRGFRPKMRAANMPNRWGIWVETCTTSSWPSPSSPGCTVMALPSIGTTAMRWFSKRPRTTTSAPASGSPSSRRPAARLLPMASNCSGASSASASSMSTAASNGSQSTSTASTASAAWALVSAATTTTGSPTNRALSSASGGRAVASLSAAPKGKKRGRPRSAAVSTATTPGRSTAALVSMAPMRACA